MLIPEPVTLLMVATFLGGNAYEAYKWEHPKDPAPKVHYVYDPAYFELGDENTCGGEDGQSCGGRD